MNSAILKRTRAATLVAAAGVSPALGFLVSWRYAAGVLVTAVWAAAGFWLIEGLTRRALVPSGTRRPTRAIILLAAGKVLLYGVAVWALLAKVFPPTSHLIGFSLLMLALVAVATLTRGHAGEGREPSRGRDA